MSDPDALPKYEGYDEGESEDVTMIFGAIHASIEAIRKRLREAEAERDRLRDERDLLQMSREEGNEIMIEWAQEIRLLAPPDTDYGHGCPSCTITRGLAALRALADQEDE